MGGWGGGGEGKKGGKEKEAMRDGGKYRERRRGRIYSSDSFEKKILSKIFQVF